MADGTINEVIDVEAIQQQVKLTLEGLDSVEKKISAVFEVYAKAYEGLQGEQPLKVVMAATKEIDKATKDLTASQKEELRLKTELEKLNEKLAQAESDDAKAIVHTRLELAERNRELKREAEAQMAAKKLGDDYLNSLKQQANSINGLTEQNKMLRAARDAMDTTKQADEIQRLNAIIDANTAVIQLNQDKYVQQKMNIGNYQSALDGLKTQLLEASKALQDMANRGDTQSKEYKEQEKQLAAITGQIESFRQEVQAATKDVEPMQTKLKALKQEAQELQLAMKDGAATAEMVQRFQEVTKEAAKLQDNIGDVSARIRALASDTATFDAWTDGITTVTSGFQVWQGTLAAVGADTEKFKEILQRLAGAQAVVNGLTAISNKLNKDSILMAKLSIAAESQNIVVKKAATAAQWLLNKAVLAFPYVAIAVGIGAIGVALAKYAINTSEAGRQQKILNDIQKESLDIQKKEVGELTKLITTAKLYKAGSKERTDAIKSINEQYGDYLPKLLTEESSVKDITAAYEALIPVLQKQALVKASMTQFDETAERRVKLAGEEAKSLSKVEKAQEGAAKAWEIYNKTKENGGNKLAIDMAYESVLKNQRVLAEVTGSYNDLVKENDEERKKIAKDEAVIAKTAEKAIEGLGAAQVRNTEATKTQIKADNELLQLQRKLTDTQLAGVKFEEERAKKQLKITSDRVVKDLELQKEEIRRSDDTETAKANKIAEINKIISATRENYLKDSAELEAKFAQEAAIAVINTRILLAKEGSDDELQARKDLINRQLEYELSILPKGHAKRAELEAKAKKDIEKLDEDSAKRKRDIEIENIDNQLEYVKKGTIEELGLTTDRLELQKEAEVKAAEKSGADVEAVKKKWDAKIAEETGKWLLESMNEDNKAWVKGVEERANAELKANEEAFAQGKITLEKYELEKQAITNKYSKEVLRAQIDNLKALIASENLTDEQVKSAREQLAAFEKQLDGEVTDEKIENRKRQLEAEKELAEKQKELARTVADFAMQLANQMFEGRVEKLEAEKEALQEAHDREIENIEASGYSKEEEEARKRAANAKTREQEKKIEEQIKEEKRKAAIANKAAAIIQAGITSALAVLAALAPPPVGLGPVLGVPLAVTTAALGAIQIAAIAAAPIPQYKDGRDGGKAEYAIVGDGGRQEVIWKRDGRAFATPATSTLTYLDAGDRVVPSMEEFVKLTAMPEYSATQSVVNVDLSGMIAEQKRQGERMREMIRNQSEFQIESNSRTFRAFARGVGGRKERMNNIFINR